MARIEIGARWSVGADGLRGPLLLLGVAITYRAFVVRRSPVIGGEPEGLMRGLFVGEVEQVRGTHDACDHAKEPAHIDANPDPEPVQTYHGCLP